MSISSSADDRFWSKVDKTPACWLWTAPVNKNGVGQYRLGKKMVQPHRYAWELFHGQPPGRFLRRGCGQLRCVRPDHMVPAEDRGGFKSLGRPPAARFRALVKVGPRCWTWRGPAVRGGYGQFRDYDADARRPTMVLAHRFAWEVANGAIPAGCDVVHICGNRACVRPDHLRLHDPEITARRPTPRQLEILAKVARHGTKYGALVTVAQELGIAPQTVRNEVYQLRKRLGVPTTTRAIEWLMAAALASTLEEPLQSP
jgi:DNA-binding CsgD family transcriptional regulator